MAKPNVRAPFDPHIFLMGKDTLAVGISSHGGDTDNDDVAVLVFIHEFWIFYTLK
jgi:hypothetical protein